MLTLFFLIFFACYIILIYLYLYIHIYLNTINELVQNCSMIFFFKTVFLHNKLVKSYKMHIMLSFHLLQKGSIFLRIFWIYWMLRICLFWKQDHRKQYINVRCTNNTKFENVTFENWKQFMHCIYAYKSHSLLTFDC